MGTRVLSWWQSSLGVKLATHRLLHRSIKNGTTPLLPLYPFMAWKGKTLTLLNNILFSFHSALLNLISLSTLTKLIHTFYLTPPLFLANIFTSKHWLVLKLSDYDWTNWYDITVQALYISSQALGSAVYLWSLFWKSHNKTWYDQTSLLQILMSVQKLKLFILYYNSCNSNKCTIYNLCVQSLNNLYMFQCYYLAIFRELMLRFL